ncbi:LacI family DNA-binding transcriptional regulator [Anaerolentibacter hominis]|uniref:LacI family DNA-binding transcriptional regulator n=1 Tax=Anaerolentibacter hominis TaxID=3079009 RepID=UPI0031B7EDC2
MQQEKISIKQIADLADVSVATVSRIINQSGRFSRETEERVRKIMEENHYVPNMLAKGLRTSRGSTIGVIIPDITGDFFSKIALEIQTGMFEAGYSTIICNTNRDAKMEKQCLEMLRSQQVSGLVHIYRSTFENPYTLDIPTIYLDTDPGQSVRKANSRSVIIESDNEAGGYLAASELIRKGCRKIAVMMSDRNYTHLERYEGYRQALDEAGIPVDESLIMHVDTVSIEAGCRAMQDFWKERKADGIFCMNDSFAIGTLRAMNQMEIKVPEQFKIIGYDASAILEAANPPVTTILQPYQKMGKLAVMLLVDMMNGKYPRKREYVMPVKLMKRKST